MRMPASKVRRRDEAIRSTPSRLNTANSPSASTVTIPPCTIRPNEWTRRSVTSVTQPSNTASSPVSVGRR